MCVDEARKYVFTGRVDEPFRFKMFIYLTDLSYCLYRIAPYSNCTILNNFAPWILSNYSAAG